MTEPEGTLSPERAAAVWRRAAQLQAEAAQRLDERSQALTVGRESADPHPQDFTLDEVRAAALEAGIAPEFVALAVAESGEEGGVADLSPRQEAVATRYLGVAQRTLEARRRIERPAAQVYEALQRVLPAHPWYLALRDSTGDPLAGGILVFDIPGYMEAQQSKLSYHGTAVDVQQLQVMLHPAGPDSCDLVISTGLRRSVRRNFKVSGWLTGIMTAMGGGGAAAVAAAAGVAGGILALPAVAGAAALGGITAVGYGAAYRYSLRKMEEIFSRILQSVDAHARTGGAFAPVPRPGAPGGGDGDGGMNAALIVTTIT
jgi:hypothetical protein